MEKKNKLSEYMPKIEVDSMKFEENGYQRGKYYWKSSTLYDYVKQKGLKPFKFPLATFDMMGYNTCFSEMDNFYAFSYQCKRVMNADLKYPIIFDDYGQIADGYHRVLKALIEGNKYIMAYRLPSMPNPDEINKENKKESTT